jgi:hypothetical protein
MRSIWFTTSLVLIGLLGYAQEAPVQETEKVTKGPKMVVESFAGKVTDREIQAFKNYIDSVPAPKTHDRNVMVYGNPGKILEACGMMYEVSKDMAILNRMIYYSDAAMAGRNDVEEASNGGRRLLWTGKVEAVWPSSQPSVSPADAGIATGSVLAHILYTAKLILSDPSIWDKKIEQNNAKAVGVTYKERAQWYVKEADYVIDTWILPHYVRADQKFYFPGAPNQYKPNEAAPWNQLFMLTNGLIRLSQCHVLLKDSPERVKHYDEMVKVNVTWFKDNVTPFKSATGTSCWKFNYALVSRKEDTNHFAYDSEGMWLAWDAGKYGVTLQDMTMMANTYFDVVLAKQTSGRFAGYVDGSTGTGHAGGDNYVRDEYIYLADIRKDKFDLVGEIEKASGKIAQSAQITARLLWVKNRRFKAGIR